ncbi:MAG: response regulator [Burkholderiaceae bacterium]
MTDSRSGAPVKPRILIADDSRIVRATLIRHVQGMFDFREALDGEQAWEMLLLDPTIRVLITDLTMPRLDGYELLARIRGSKISRIRNLPVVVISGSDEPDEHARARQAGATEMITKGIGTAPLLSRLDVLSRAAATQQDYERELQRLIDAMPSLQEPQEPLLPALDEFTAVAGRMLDGALRQRRNFFLLHLQMSIVHASGASMPPPEAVAAAVGALLKRTIRQTDCIGKADPASFVLAISNLPPEAARSFAGRLCAAMAQVQLPEHVGFSLTAACGLAGASEAAAAAQAASIPALHDIAARRAALGVRGGSPGIVGALEEAALVDGHASVDLAG